MKFSIFNFQFSILLFTFSFLIFNLGKPALAENMESDSYKLKDTNLNMTSGEKSSENYNVTDTVGQTGSGKYSSSGFIVKAGFQYVYGVTPFTFSISKSAINFNNLIPSNPATDTLGLSITSGGSHGYTVTVIADKHLEKNNGIFIAGTTCDHSEKPCSVERASIWDSFKAYGFGYNITGEDIPNTFVSINYFRPFPTEKEGFKPAVLMSNASVGRKKEALMTVKLNVSAEQETGEYQNTLKFVAIPSY